MRWKSVFAVLLAWSAVMGNASAEQPAAEEYRQIFRSGTFYVEYKDAYTSRILAETEGKRMERTSYNDMAWVLAFNPLGSLFGGEDKFPEVLHRNGKYYQFVEDNEAMVISEDQMAAENLNPRQGWNTVRKKLALPTELAVFYWEDPYRDKSAAIAVPQFAASMKKALGGKEYECDRYVSAVRSINGGEEAQLVYDMFYDNGNLVEAHSIILQGGQEYPVNEVKIRKLTAEIPKGAFKISKKTKVYAAGIGDMNDLLENPTQVETMGEI